jgi:hypothetical protein
MNSAKFLKTYTRTTFVSEPKQKQCQSIKRLMFMVLDTTMHIGIHKRVLVCALSLQFNSNRMRATQEEKEVHVSRSIEARQTAGAGETEASPPSSS